MGKQPTQEQRKEFWEWCRLVHINNPITEIEVANSCEAAIMDKPVNGWYLPDYDKGESKLISLKETPSIDLNNLFKYAVPIAYIKLFTEGQGVREAYKRLFNSWLEKFFEGYSFEDALFWALKEVICQKQGS